MEREIFCPLVNGECKDNCIFISDCDCGCNLQDAVERIQEFEEDYINNGGLGGIVKKLEDIKSNIPDEYTYQSYSVLNDIHRELLKITDKNE